MKINDYLSNEYKAFALYTIKQRAIPSMIDGFKPVQRKIAYISTKLWKGTTSEKPKKIFQLAGITAADGKYHHGDKSLNDAITGMAQPFKNNMPLFDREGQFGDLRSKEAGAPRYIGVKLNSNFQKLYKDSNLLTPKFDEGDEIEPEYFLPIIPTVIINGTSGIAVGFKTNIYNRSTKDVIKACQNELNNKPNKRIIPYIDGFNGKFSLITDKNHKNFGQWLAEGTWKQINATTIEINEIAPSQTFDKYETLLDGLIDKKVIVSYEDECSSNIKYIVKLTKESLNDLISKNKVESTFKITEVLLPEILNVLDENGELAIFDNEISLIKEFIKFRTTYYIKRKTATLDIIRKELKIMGSRYKFMIAVIKGQFEPKNSTKELMIEFFKESKFYEDEENGFDYLLRMPIHSMTKETIEKLKKDTIDKKAEYDYIDSKEPLDMFKEDLDILLKSI